jgi:hypothetical protein
MKQRLYTPITKFCLALLAAGAGAALPLSAQMSEAGITTASDIITIAQMQAKPNPTGLKLGFWEVFNRQDTTLTYLGKRPTSRVGFDAWNAIETAPGQYDFTNVSVPYTRVHNYGETIYVAVNIAFTHLVTPGKQTIPSFYAHNNGGTDTDRISDPTTRAAAKAFLRAYVQYMLQQVGNLTLTIDYEIVSNYKLYTNADGQWAARSKEWSDWYVEAAAVARQAAADLGMADRLKLQPIVNGNPLDTTNPINKGAGSNGWLVSVVSASDALALDTYHCIAGQVTSAQETIDIIQFWITQFAGGKPVVVTENGFTTCLSNGITPPDPEKYAGTELQQQAYYTDLFPKLQAANLPGGAFQNKLRSFNIWGITDNQSKKTTDSDRYFGLVRLDPNTNAVTTPKPAMAVLQSNFQSMESNAFHQPSLFTQESIVTTPLLAGTGKVNLTFAEGDKYEYLHYEESLLPKAAHYTLQVTARNSSNLILCVNGTTWLYQSANTQFNVDLTSYVKAGTKNTVDLYFTNVVFPFTQQVQALKLVESN